MATGVNKPRKRPAGSRPAVVYLVQHVHKMTNGEEDIKLIGVFSTRTAAKASIANLRRRPGFRKAPRGFFIDRYEIDREHWAEGYSTS